MLKLFDIGYDELKDGRSEELYQLRKETFRDRLKWDVNCINGLEFDEFDNADTQYIIGITQGQIICSVRFINLKKPNMITHTFKKCFQDVKLPEGIESSRFFVDKVRSAQLLGNNFPITLVLFLSVIHYTRLNHMNHIHTIVSQAMLTIIKRSGWYPTVLKEAFLNPDEPIYLITLPTGDADMLFMANKANQILQLDSDTLKHWPLAIPIKQLVY